MKILFNIQNKVVGVEEGKIVLIHANGDKDYPKLHPSAKYITYPLYPGKVPPKVDACVRKAFMDTGLYSEEQIRAEPIKRHKSSYLGSSDNPKQYLYFKERQSWAILNMKQLYASTPMTE